MFTDTRISIELTNDFKEYSEVVPDSPRKHRLDLIGFDFAVNILTTTNWPYTAKNNTCSFPSQIQEMITKFESFYLEKHPSRRLTWMNNLGTGDLKSTFFSGSKELNLSTFAMIVLLKCFNNSGNESVLYEDILSQTEIEDGELKRTLQSLSLGKHRILSKLQKGKQINTGDQFQVNLDFNSQLTKIKILQISGDKHLVKINQETIEKVATERKFHIEAAIVRVMKARTRVGHNLLVAEVLEQISMRFLPDVEMVKKTIESLIERDYMERDLEDRTVYVYIA